jgi:hypothetical protein
MEEANELAFLFGREAGDDDEELGQVTQIQQELLGVIGRLELLHQRLANWHILLSKRHTMEELALLLGDDQCLG